MKAVLLGSTYKVKASGNPTKVPKALNTCPICLEVRRCVSSHLLRVHNVSKRNKEIKGMGTTKLSSTAIVAEGIYKTINQVLDKFENDFFNNLDGSRMAIKPETNQKAQKRKVRSVKAMCYFIIDKTNDTSLEGIVRNIRMLGEHNVGYFDQHRKLSSDKGKQMDYVIMLCLNQIQVFPVFDIRVHQICYFLMPDFLFKTILT